MLWEKLNGITAERLEFSHIRVGGVAADKQKQTACRKCKGESTFGDNTQNLNPLVDKGLMVVIRLAKGDIDNTVEMGSEETEIKSKRAMRG